MQQGQDVHVQCTCNSQRLFQLMFALLKIEWIISQKVHCNWIWNWKLITDPKQLKVFECELPLVKVRRGELTGTSGGLCCQWGTGWPLTFFRGSGGGLVRERLLNTCEHKVPCSLWYLQMVEWCTMVRSGFLPFLRQEKMYWNKANQTGAWTKGRLFLAVRCGRRCCPVFRCTPAGCSFAVG